MDKAIYSSFNWHNVMLKKVQATYDRHRKDNQATRQAQLLPQIFLRFLGRPLQHPNRQGIPTIVHSSDNPSDSERLPSNPVWLEKPRHADIQSQQQDLLIKNVQDRRKVTGHDDES